MREAKVLSVIRTDGGTQARAGLDEAKVEEYAQLLREATATGSGWPFKDAIDLFYDGEVYWLADGFHRVEACRRVDHKTVLADVRQGTRRDAILYACGANADHGLPRTADDKRRAVETMLRDEEWGTWSDRAIAKKCKVSHPFVAKIRADLNLTGNVSSEERTYITRHGTPATMDTSKIGNGTKSLEPDYEPVGTLQNVALDFSRRKMTSLENQIKLLEEMKADHKNPYWTAIGLPLTQARRLFRIGDLRQAVNNALDTLWQQAIWQSEQEIATMQVPEDLVYEVPSEQFQEIYKLYSADCIASGQKVRGLFEHDGSRWLCVGGGGSECDACMLVPRAEFGGTIMQKYSHIVRRRRDDKGNFYYGLLISFQGQEYVVAWPRATFHKAKDRPDPAPVLNSEQTQEPTPAPVADSEPELHIADADEVSRAMSNLHFETRKRVRRHLINKSNEHQADVDKIAGTPSMHMLLPRDGGEFSDYEMHQEAAAFYRLLADLLPI